MTGLFYLEAFISDYMENEWGLPLGVLLRGGTETTENSLSCVINPLLRVLLLRLPAALALE